MELRASWISCSLSSSACRLDWARVATKACSTPGVWTVSGLDRSSCPSCVVSVPSRADTGRDSDTADLTSSLSPSTSFLTFARGYNAVSPCAHSTVTASPGSRLSSWTRYLRTIVRVHPVSSSMSDTAIPSTSPARATDRPLPSLQ